MENIFAFTETNYQPSFYPGFISINKQNDGTLSVSVRERGNDTGKAALIDVSPETLEHLAAAIMAFFGAQEADRTPAADAVGQVSPTGEQLYTMVTTRFKSGSFPWAMVAESGRAAWSAAAAELVFAPDTIMAAYGNKAAAVGAARQEGRAA